MSVSKNYYTGVDLFKLYAALGILAIHTNLPFFNIVGRLGVPFFAITSSFFFFKKYIKASRSVQRKKILLKYCKRILALYVLWQIVYLPLALKAFVKIMQMFNGINLKSIFLYIIYFFGPALYNAKGINVTYDANGWLVSWYLLASLVGIIVFCLIIKLFRSNLLIIGIICISLEIYFILINEFNFINHYSPILTHTFLRLFIYFYVGYILAINPELRTVKGKRFLTICLLSCLVFFVLENCTIHYLGGIFSNEETILTLPTSIILILYALNYNPSLHNPLYIRNLSTFMYCSQIWPLTLIKLLFMIFGIVNYPLLLFFIVFGLIMLGYCIFTILMHKFNIKILKYMV